MVCYNTLKENKEVACIGKGNVMKAKLRVMASVIKNCLIKTVSLIFYLFPINKKKIVVYNFAGNGYGDNPKYLIKEIVKYGDYKIIWCVKNLDQDMPAFIKKVKYNSLCSMYHMITAKLWIDTIRNNPRPLFKRKKQVYIQTWHGGIFIKGQEKDAEDTLSKKYIKSAKRDGKLTDYMLSNCKKRTQLIQSSFWYNGKILEFGVPRDDVLFIPNKKEIDAFKKKYGIEDKKILLYAPSFRNNKDFYKNLKFNINKLMQSVGKKFGDNYVFCIKLHPNDSQLTELKDFNNVINFSAESDSQLILSASDIVISDYSSMFLDFLLTKRPAFIFAPDYDEYIKKERNLYVDISNIGIPFAKNFNDLLREVDNFDQNNYKANVEKFIEYYEIFENGNSSSKIVKYLKEEKYTQTLGQLFFLPLKILS